MKKVFALALLTTGLLFTSVNTEAQTSGELKTADGIAFDTVSNTATTKYLYTPEVSGLYKVASISLSADKVSGAVDGTATLEASNDGVSWYSYYDSKDSVYSYTLTDKSAQGYRWQLYDVGDLKFRVKVVVSGTQVARITGYFRLRK
ncbi:MAG TPA: hypothetical protein VJ552_05360 [Sediminibacterium sp.]|nr:hypothetical protein [Sediminibacterium sp.]